jgi:hypothetical protein
VVPQCPTCPAHLFSALWSCLFQVTMTRISSVEPGFSPLHLKVPTLVPVSMYGETVSLRELLMPTQCPHCPDIVHQGGQGTQSGPACHWPTELLSSQECEVCWR